MGTVKGANGRAAVPDNVNDENDTRSSSNQDTQDDEEEYPIDHKTDLRFVRVEHIASGSTSYVEDVEETTTGRCFARKRFIIGRPQHRKSVLAVFANEVKTIRRLEGHVHFVRVYAAYAMDRSFSLVLEPKASDGDLAMFLDAFGCLASGLAFMHKQKIRHKDVKPGNILLHQGKVYWTDFGYAKDSILLEHSLTDGGIDGGITDKYAAFEVLSRGERNSKADIFSLACVFMEIYFAVVLKQWVPECQIIYAHKMTRLSGQLTKGLITQGIPNSIPQLKHVARVIANMGLFTPTERPDAATVCLQIFAPKQDELGCAKCRVQFIKHEQDDVKSQQTIDSPTTSETSRMSSSRTTSTSSQISSITRTAQQPFGSNEKNAAHTIGTKTITNPDLNSERTPAGSSPKPSTIEPSVKIPQTPLAGFSSPFPKGKGAANTHQRTSTPSTSNHASNPRPYHNVNDYWTYDAQYQRYIDYVYDHKQQAWVFAKWMPVGFQPSQQPVSKQPTTSSLAFPSHPLSYPQAFYDPRGIGSTTYGRNSPQPAAARSDAGYAGPPGSPAYGAASPSSSSGQTSPWSSVIPAYSGAQSLAAVSLQPQSTIASNPRPERSYHRSPMPRGKGGKIRGTYFPGQNSLHYEKVDVWFYVRDKPFFHVGRVFAVMMNETAGAHSNTSIDPDPTGYNSSSSITSIKYGDHFVHTNVRRFVVVRLEQEHCYALPIFTYSRRATTKKGVRPSEHGIAYSWNQTPQLLKGEGGVPKAPVAIVMAERVSDLHIASRIRYALIHPIQYNVKVKEIGYVTKQDLPKLIGNWKSEDDYDDFESGNYMKHEYVDEEGDHVGKEEDEDEEEVKDEEEDEDEEEAPAAHTNHGFASMDQFNQ